MWGQTWWLRQTCGLVPSSSSSWVDTGTWTPRPEDLPPPLGSRTRRCTNSSPWGSGSASSRSALQLHPRDAKGRAADPSLRGRRDGHRRHLDTARGTKGSTTHGKRWTTPYSCGTTSLKVLVRDLRLG